MDCGPFVYACLRACKVEEREFSSLQRAVDAACADIDDRGVVPLGIRDTWGVVYAMAELVELYAGWSDWRRGMADHPLASAA